ncbi:MAG: hypothetical protein HUU50_15455 [Candidatus Brocadiae bacterium]|nr:hypothetical protein [Candidatus Brocadiia bacterium]
MISDTLQKLLKSIHKDRDTFDKWFQNPVEKSKEWGLDLDEKTIETIKNILQFQLQDEQQMQEIHRVNQRSVMKLSEASKNNRFSFYSSLVMHILIFSLSVLMICLGIYAAFTGSSLLGFILGLAGTAEVVYFLLGRPLQSLNENTSNLVQMEVALGGWFNEMAYWQVFVKNTHLEEKQVVAQAMRDATRWTIMLIEDYCSLEHKAPTSEKEESDFQARTKSLVEAIKVMKNQAFKKIAHLTEKKEEAKNVPSVPPENKATVEQATTGVKNV